MDITFTVQSVGYAIAGILIYLARRNQIPKYLRRWRDLITPERLEAAVEQATKFAELAPEGRKLEATEMIQRWSKKTLGFQVPTSVLNTLVEMAYQSWKRK